MIFNSFSFIYFFFIVLTILGLERLFSKNVILRNLTLLLASYFFYGSFNWWFLILLIYITLLNYFAGVLIHKRKYPPSLSIYNLQSEVVPSRWRFRGSSKTIVGITIVLSLLPLIFFKYTLFFIKSFSSLLSFELNTEFIEGLLLPVGISFFTFQALSYVIDLYRGKVEYCKSLLNFALFVSFFPTILSGPIEKARELLPQIKKYCFPSGDDLLQGFCIFIWGLFKKIVIADRLANYVDWAYESNQYESGSTLAVAAVFYSIQIYCDFSGYSDMALGVAKALGFNITKNFRQPYLSRTIKEFWRKWHIALTTWFTEYVYFSLGGSRVSAKWKWIRNISLVFVLSGIWHGAAWSFLIWGGLHAVYYLGEYYLGFQKQDFKWNIWNSTIGGVIVFFLVTIAWIFFRVTNLNETWHIIVKIFSDWSVPFSMGASSFTFAVTIVCLIIFIIYEFVVRLGLLSFDTKFNGRNLTYNIIFSIPLLIMIGLCSRSADTFVYFQF